MAPSSSSLESCSVRSTVKNIQIAYGSPRADLYEDILKCSPKASPRTVQQSFFNRRNELFTQITAGSEEAETKMDAVVMAFRLLENPEQRNEYDVLRDTELFPPTSMRRSSSYAAKKTKIGNHHTSTTFTSSPKRSNSTPSNLYSRHTIEYDKDEIPNNKYSPQDDEFSTNFTEAFGVSVNQNKNNDKSILDHSMIAQAPSPSRTTKTTPSSKFIPTTASPASPKDSRKRTVTPPKQGKESPVKRTSGSTRSQKSMSPTKKSIKSLKPTSSKDKYTPRGGQPDKKKQQQQQQQPGRISSRSPSDERGFRDRDHSSIDGNSYTDEGTIESSVWTTEDETATRGTYGDETMTVGDETIDTMGEETIDTMGDETIDTLEETEEDTSSEAYRKRKKQTWKANSHKYAEKTKSTKDEKWTGGRVVKVIKEEVEGAYADTCSAFDQVFNAFTLNEKDIIAVSGRILKAQKEFFKE
mmetsp:Transcript_19157/g.27054  ORF Transcript_19157/g.27054 Transcript_19157/m.27054 type:complete len:469 (+) Transcript_19157:124-1530(+)